MVTGTPVERFGAELVLAAIGIAALMVPSGALAAESSGGSEAGAAADGAVVTEEAAEEERSGEEEFALAIRQRTFRGQPTEAPETGIAASVLGGGMFAQDAALEDGALFGATVAYFTHPNVGAEAGIWYTSRDVLPSVENEIAGGGLDTIVVTGNAVFRYPVHRRFVPYGTGGVAFFVPDFQVNSAVVDNLSSFGFDLTEEVENAVGFNVGGGVEVILSENFGIFGDARYFVGQADTSSTLTDQATGTSNTQSGTQDFDGVSAAVGIRIYF